MLIVNQIIKNLKTPRIFVFTIIWMMILVVIGTIAQKEMGLFSVQEKYFSSWFFWFWYFPLPGGRPTMILMLINLSFFLFNKNLWKISKMGILKKCQIVTFSLKDMLRFLFLCPRSV